MTHDALARRENQNRAHPQECLSAGRLGVLPVHEEAGGVHPEGRAGSSSGSHLCMMCISGLWGI